MKKQILIEKYIEPSEVEVKEIEARGGVVIKRWFDKYGDRHSFMGHPSVIYYNKDWQVIEQYWHKKNQIHRNRTLPAYIFYENGQIISQEFYTNGEFIKIKFY